MKRIEDLAIRLRSVLGIPDDVRPASLDTLTRMQIAGVISDFGVQDDVSANAAAAWLSDERKVSISSQAWADMQSIDASETRFTTYHEIGHAVLGHSNRLRKFGGDKQFGARTDFEEDEADFFAEAFAVPLSHAFRAPLHDIGLFTAYSGLPPNHAERRMASLQRYIRELTAAVSDGEPDDSYAEAMSIMRRNAISWNS